MKPGDLVAERSRVRAAIPGTAGRARGWIGIIIATAKFNADRAPEHREVQVHFPTHNVSRWMLPRQLEVLSEAR